MSFSTSNADIISTATKVVGDALPIDGPESAFRRVEAELRAELIVNVHKLDFLLKHRSILLEEMARVKASLSPAPIVIE